MELNRLVRGLAMFVFTFGVESLEQSVKLDRLIILISLAIFQTDNQKVVLFTVFSLLELFSAAVLLLRLRKKTYLKRRPLLRSQIFSVAKSL